MNTKAQVTIGSLDEPHEGAVLELKSESENKGMLLPRISLNDVSVFQLDGDSSTAEGMIIFNTNESAINGKGSGTYVWCGEKWVLIGETPIVTAAIPIRELTIVSNTNIQFVNVGESFQATVNVAPDNATNKSVLWSISNVTGTATVDPITGVVTGLTTGRVNLIAYAMDGRGVIATKRVNVNAGYITSAQTIANGVYEKKFTGHLTGQMLSTGQAACEMTNLYEAVNQALYISNEDLGPNISWIEANNICKSLGGRLPNLAELEPLLKANVEWDTEDCYYWADDTSNNMFAWVLRISPEHADTYTYQRYRKTATSNGSSVPTFNIPTNARCIWYGSNFN